ncbi:MAG: hypothetical protein U5K79_17265 [Cyclobacteriaceae bacterium]|nr:hypothetical protein [Cyclobacteriaceae bacterium]
MQSGLQTHLKSLKKQLAMKFHIILISLILSITQCSNPKNPDSATSDKVISTFENGILGEETSLDQEWSNSRKENILLTTRISRREIFAYDNNRKRC